VVMTPTELQEALPLLGQLLLLVVIGALLVGSFFAIVGFMFRNAVWITMILGVIIIFMNMVP
jgi:magnesium-transporting ATPase (P-type)